jgi:hypothetical protein
MSAQEESIYAELDRLGDIFAKAKANRVYLHEFRKTKKALLMKQAAVGDVKMSAANQERDAYAHPEYQELLEGLKSATEYEEATRYQIETIRMKFEAWRSKRSTERAEMGLR